MTEKFDFEQALADLKAGKPITGKDSVLGPLVKQLTEAALEAKIDTHLAQEVTPKTPYPASLAMLPVTPMPSPLAAVEFPTMALPDLEVSTSKGASGLLVPIPTLPPL